MKTSGLVRRHIVGFPQKAQILVRREDLADEGYMRIPADDKTYVGFVLSRGHERQPDGSYLVPVEKVNTK